MYGRTRRPPFRRLVGSSLKDRWRRSTPARIPLAPTSTRRSDCVSKGHRLTFLPQRCERFVVELFADVRERLLVELALSEPAGAGLTDDASGRGEQPGGAADLSPPGGNSGDSDQAVAGQLRYTELLRAGECSPVPLERLVEFSAGMSDQAQVRVRPGDPAGALGSLAKCERLLEQRTGRIGVSLRELELSEEVEGTGERGEIVAPPRDLGAL
jgi:hypothetical protein